jgi:hypothetical protein
VSGSDVDFAPGAVFQHVVEFGSDQLFNIGRGFNMCRMMAVPAVLMLCAVAVSANELTFAVPGKANSTPWVAAADRFVAVAWGAAAEGKGDIMIAISRDGGRVFGTPVRVNSTAGDARINGEIAPRVTLQQRGKSDPLVTVAWNAKDSTTQIRTARSTDGGRTFTEAASLQPAGIAGDRGWQAAALDDRGTLHTIWLDHRAMAVASAKGHEAHKGEHDGVAMAQRSSLYYAAGGGSERELFKGVCYCCKTALAIGPGGQVYAAWRHVFANNMRDIAFTVSRDGGRTFAPLLRVHEDKWSIDGCPDDGPAMAVDGAGTVHLVWPTVLNGEQGALLYATSKDGQRFSDPMRVPTLGAPKPSHPQIAIDRAGRVMLAWDEVLGGVRTAAARSVSRRSERVEFGDIVKLAEGASAYPVLAATSEGWLAAWTTAGPSPTVRARILR